MNGKVIGVITLQNGLMKQKDKLVYKRQMMEPSGLISMNMSKSLGIFLFVNISMVITLRPLMNFVLIEITAVLF
jgi:hypothetical protein